MAHFIDPWRNGGTGTGAYVLQANTASQIPLSVQAAAGQTANAFVVENSAGSDLFSVDPSGNVTLAGSISAVVNETVTGNLTLTGALTVTGASIMNGNVTLGDIQTDTLTVNAISTFKSMVTMNTDLIGNIVQLQEQGVDPANGANIGKVYSKEVAGITELFYIDSSSNVTQITAAGAEVVAGPASSTDNAAARWDGITGRLLQNSIVIIGDNAAGSVALDIAAPIMTTANVIDVGDANSLTTGGILNLVSNSADGGTRALVRIVNDNTLATGAQCLFLQQDATMTAFEIDSNGNGVVFRITSSATTSAVVHVVDPANTTGIVFDIASADSLSTGSGLRVLSNSANTSTRNVVTFVNDNTLATGATVLNIQQDAAQRAVFIDQNANSYGLVIDSEATSLSSILIDTPVQQTGTIFSINAADSLTTGNIVDFSSSSTSASVRALVYMSNNSTSATGAILLQIEQYSNALGFDCNATVDIAPVTLDAVTALSALRVVAAGHTALTASTEYIDVNLALNRTVQFATGALTTQRAVNIAAPTYGFVAASTLTTASTFVVTAAPAAGTNATITNSYVAQFGGAVNLGATSAGLTYGAVDLPSHTLTVTGTTQVTSVGPSLLRLGTLTVTDASAVTIDTAAALYIAGPVTAAGSVTLTNGYSMWIDAGAARFDGRVMETQGADVASATNITLGTDGNSFELTGTTKVDLISNLNWTEGSVVTLIANESVVIDHGTATSGTNVQIRLAGAADFSMTAGDTLTLRLSSTTAEGQAWRELSRSAI